MEYLKKSFFVVLTTVCAFFFSISLQSAIAAWVAPTANPPAGNVATPLNVSSQGQSKDGGLILNHLNAASSGLIVEYGNVGIGTVSPAQKLDVAGNVKANQYCIGSSCISSWSQAGTGDNLGNHTATANLNIGNYEIDNVSYLDIRAGDGYGVRFWSNDAYAINMGNSSEYHYGPVTDYSIKTNMSNTSGRGWTWGIDGATPVAGLSTTGNMQIAGEFKSSWIHSTGSGNNTFAGNVGIGTVSPAQKLQVNGNVLVKESSLIIDRPNTTGGWARGVHYYDLDNYSGTELAGIGLYGAGTSVSRMYLTIGDDPWSKTTGIQILTSGNVGIGTVSPAQKLDVAGNVKANQYCIGSSCISSWSGAGATYTAGAGISISGTTITNTGDTNASDDITSLIAGAGISITGTGNSRTISSIVSGDNLGNHTATANLNIGNYEIDNASYLDIRAGDGYGVRFWSNDAYAINMGNSSEYHYGPVTDYSIKTNMSNTSGRGWTWGIDGATPVAGLSTTGNMQIAGEFKSNWIHSTGSGNNTFAGNVGIGTASPAQKLDVAGNVKANQYCIGANCVSNWGFADIACDWTGWYVVGSSVVDGCIWGCLTSVHEWGLNIYCDNGKITSASAALINVCTQCDTYSGVEGGAF